MNYIITENQYKILRRATEIESGIEDILNKIILFGFIKPI